MVIRCLISFIFIYSSCSGQSVNIGDWKTERKNNQRTNYIQANITREKPNVIWEKRIKFLYAPVVADGIVYLSDPDHNFYAFDIGRDKELWSIKTDEPVYKALIDDNDVIYVNKLKTIMALDRKTGKQLDEIKNKYAWKVQDSLLYTMSYNYSKKESTSLSVFDTKSGKEIWSISDSSLSIPVINNGILYIIKHSKSKLYALDALTGTELWNIDCKFGAHNPVLIGGEILLHDQFTVYAYNQKDGTELWYYKLKDYCMVLGVSKEVVYLGSRNSGTQRIEIHTLDLKTGKVKWIKKYESASFFTSTVANDDVVILGINSLSLDGFSAVLYALNSENGHEIWKKEFDDCTISSEIIALNNVIMLTVSKITFFGDLNSVEYLYLLK